MSWKGGGTLILFALNAVKERLTGRITCHQCKQKTIHSLFSFLTCQMGLFLPGNSRKMLG